MAEKTLEQAKKLIGERKFPQAEKVCQDLIRKKKDVEEATILAAASLLCQGCGEKEAKKRERIRKAVALALASARGPAQRVEARNRMLSAMSRYRREQMEASLAKQRQKPSLPELKNYFDLGAKYEKLPDMLREEGEKAGISEAAPDWEGELDRQLSDAEYEISRSAFGEARMLTQFHGSGTGKEVGEILRQAVEKLAVAQILAARCHMPALDGATKQQRLESEAEIIRWGLCCVLHPDGQELSLYSGGREELLEKLKGLYEQIGQGNPAFQPPELPTLEGVNTIPQTSRR